MTYIFSVRPQTFEKIRDLIDEKTKLGRLRITDMSDEDGSKVVHREMEIEAKILKILQESGEKYEYFDDGELESAIVSGFEFYFKEKEGLKLSKELATPPEQIGAYWDGIKKLLKKKEVKKLAIQNVVEEEGYNKEQMPLIFDRWISIIKHIAENGNWYYDHVGS